jgi:hypothetical protein
MLAPTHSSMTGQRCLRPQITLALTLLANSCPHMVEMGA